MSRKENNREDYSTPTMMMILIIVAVMLLQGCAGTTDTRIPAHPKEKIVVFETYAEFCQMYEWLTVGRKCGYKKLAYVRDNTIYLRPEWTTCNLNHERAHMWGWKHKGKDGSCGPWQIDPSWGRQAKAYTEEL